jgi:hypothetical protein
MRLAEKLDWKGLSVQCSTSQMNTFIADSDKFLDYIKISFWSRM